MHIVTLFGDLLGNHSSFLNPTIVKNSNGTELPQRGVEYTDKMQSTFIEETVPVTVKLLIGRELFTPLIGGGTPPIDVNTHPRLCSPLGCVYCSSGVFVHSVGF